MTVNSAFLDSCTSVVPNTLRTERRYQEMIYSQNIRKENENLHTYIN